MDKKILIYMNDTEGSARACELIMPKLRGAGFDICRAVEDEPELIVCIGGDGTFLDLVHKLDFPRVPIIGINTGHLGFFQELQPEDTDAFIANYIKGNYCLQSMQTVKAIIVSETGTDEITSLNEIIVKGSGSYSIHLDISIGGSLIERFSGDGILVSTPAGSTAYNYSLGGSIVDPRLKLLQVTPMAPMNTTAYRSFTSSLLLPPDQTLGIIPQPPKQKSTFTISYDGFSREYDSIDSIELMLSETTVELIRFSSYDFWSKVKSKFL